MYEYTVILDMADNKIAVVKHILDPIPSHLTSVTDCNPALVNVTCLLGVCLCMFLKAEIDVKYDIFVHVDLNILVAARFIN